MRANKALIQGAYSSAPKFQSYRIGRKDDDLSRQMRMQRMYEDREVRKYIENLGPGAEVDKLPGSMQEPVTNFLNDNRMRYGQLARIAAKAPAGSPQYMKVRSEMNKIQGRFKNLSSQLDNFKNLKQEYLSDFDEGIISKGSKDATLKQLFKTDDYLIDLSNNISLQYLYLGNNNFSGTVDVSNNTGLFVLSIDNEYGTPLTSLDVSNNTALFNLYIANNNIASIDLSANTMLNSLAMQMNPSLASIDLTNNINISSVSLNNNASLSFVDFRNGNNTGIQHALPVLGPGGGASFTVTNCPNLTQIHCDDPTWCNKYLPSPAIIASDPYYANYWNYVPSRDNSQTFVV